MLELQNKIKDLIKEDIFYITPDVKRGMGLEDILPNYHIICSFFDPIIPALKRQGAKIFCLEENEKEGSFRVNNSGKLLEHFLVSNYIDKHSSNIPNIMYFKPSVKLDILIKNKGYFPIGNISQLNEQFENKINFFNFTHKYFREHTISSEVGILGNLSFKRLTSQLGIPLVVQFGHGWAGKTTFFIETEKNFIDLSRKFCHTKVKVSSQIGGFTVLNNCCVYDNLVLISPPAIQLSDIEGLYSKPGVTCGRQWPARFISSKQKKTICEVSKRVGKLMGKAGFCGFFGLDFLIEIKSGKVYLAEINARLTASTPFYTRLERGVGNIPLLAYHLAAFLGKSLPFTNVVFSEMVGSQIIFRSRLKKAQLPPTDFGVFRVEKGKSVLVGESYFPEKLKADEYILMQRSLKDIKNEDKEIFRIETKQEVLKKPHQLKFWVNSLLGKGNP